MTRERKQPAIRKPLIDGETALRFAAAAQADDSPQAIAGTGAGGKPEKGKESGKDDGNVYLTISLSRETHTRIIHEAARKKRSVEELLQRHLVKHYGKD